MLKSNKKLFKKRKMTRNSKKFDEFVQMNGNSEMEKKKGQVSRDDPSLGGALDFKLPLMLRIRGTVINGIWWQILLVVLWSTVVVTVWQKVPALRFNFQPILIQLMGVVCGLLLAFRSNSAYDRYWEGRKYWSSMTLGIRTLTRVIWINVKEETSRDIVEKKSAINLLIAFAVATKHYLREEYDYDFEDLFNITPHLNWLHTPSSVKSIIMQNDNPPGAPSSLDKMDTYTTKKTTTTEPVFQKKRVVRNASSAAPKRHRFKAHDIATPTNIPLELSYYIGSYINSIRIRDKCDPGTLVTMSSGLVTLVECLTGFERILRTPIPLAYSVHLHQSIWIYVLALPFQLVPTNGWASILVAGITAFFLLGILAIGWELENPFGYDDNDLPLDDFCKVLRREIEVIVSHKSPAPEDWVFKSENKPFAPECHLDAIELARKPVKEVLQMLADRVTKISEIDVLDRPIIERISKSAKRTRESVVSHPMTGFDGNLEIP